MNYKILATNWYTPPPHGMLSHIIYGSPSICIGVIAIESGPDEKDWKCYIGYGFGEDTDAQKIAAHGEKVTKEVACAMFPHLPSERFKF